MITLLLLLAFQCVDYSKDPAGCQPSTFDTPIGQMPSVRVNRQGNIDPYSSEEDAKAGAAALEKELHLFRNFAEISMARGMRVGSGLPATASSWDMETAQVCGTRSTFSRSSPIRTSSRRCKSERFRQWLKEIRDSMIASCGRSYTRLRERRNGKSWFGMVARIRSAGWKRIAST